MKINIFDEKSYKIHSIKTNRYKTTRIEVVFRNSVQSEKVAKRTFLASLLNEGNKEYKNRKSIAIALEELYKPSYSCYTNKIGSALNTVFGLTFINPEYIEEEEYLNNIIKFFFNMILNPNVNNGEFDLDNFKLVKKNILLDIDSINENPEKKAINDSLKVMDEKSDTAINILGNVEMVEKFTPDVIYNEYIDMINNDNIDIFIIGNTDMDKVAYLIKKYYQNHLIRNNKINYYINNNSVSKIKYKEEESNYLQTQLVVLYNIVDLTKDEKEVTFHVLNYILGSGGLSSKLYRYIREDKNYCYRISSMYFKYDNLLCIESSLAKENVNDSISLIKKSVKEMQNGEFTEEELNDAKNNLLMSLKVNRNNPSAILANYEFNYFLGNYTIDERINLIEKITKEDIIKLARKLKVNTVYVLNEESDERN